jgi:hypothetical protein
MAARLARSSWAVFGILGVLATAGHFASAWSKSSDYRMYFHGVSLPSDRLWLWALLYLAAGGLLVALGNRASSRALTESTRER